MGAGEASRSVWNGRLAAAALMSGMTPKADVSGRFAASRNRTYVHVGSCLGSRRQKGPLSGE